MSEQLEAGKMHEWHHPPLTSDGRTAHACTHKPTQCRGVYVWRARTRISCACGNERIQNSENVPIAGGLGCAFFVFRDGIGWVCADGWLEEWNLPRAYSALPLLREVFES